MAYRHYFKMDHFYPKAYGKTAKIDPKVTKTPDQAEKSNHKCKEVDSTLKSFSSYQTSSARTIRRVFRKHDFTNGQQQKY